MKKRANSMCVAVASVLAMLAVAGIGAAATYIYNISTMAEITVVTPPPDVADLSKYRFESDDEGWKAQDYWNSLAISAVAQSTDNPKYGYGSLKCTVNLVGGHDNYSKGEAWVDMQTNPPEGVSAPVDMNNKEVSVWVYCPTEVAGDPYHPNGVQILFKDANWKSRYSDWANIYTAGGWMKLTDTPSTTKPPTGYQDDGFDPTRIIAVGVKIGAGIGSTATFSGYIWVDGFDWDHVGNRPPEASFTWKALTPVSERMVQFTNTSTDPDGTIASYLWNFGDGTESTEENPTHQYPVYGTYEVRLKVTDSDGAVTWERRSVSVVQDTSKYGFENSTQGWFGENSITTVACDGTKSVAGAWSLRCTITNFGKTAEGYAGDGYAGVDMVNSPPPGITAPVDLRNKTVSVWVWLPVPLQSSGAGIQLYFKDSNWRYADSKWRNVSCSDVGAWIKLTMNTGSSAAANTGDWGYVTSGFDLSSIRVVGVKLGVGDSWSGSYSGYMWIDAYDWS